MNLRAPIYVAIELTSACNLSCIHCYASAGTRMPGEMDTEDVKGVLEELREMKVFMVVFGGGEPFMRKDIFELIEFSRDQGLWVSIPTNGTLLTRKVADKLKSIAFHGCIQVSLHGADPATHDGFVGRKGAFLATLEGMKNLRESSLLFTTATTPLTTNFAELSRIVKMVFEMGSSKHVFMNLVPVGRGREIADLDLTPSQWKAVFALAESDSNVLVGLLGKIHMVSEDYLAKVVGGFSQVDAQYLGCKAGVTRCFVLPDGSVIPCSYLRASRFLAGNVKTESMRDIWEKSEAFSAFRNATLGDLKGKCPRCRYASLCLGGCKACSYDISGDLYAPDPRCTYEPRPQSETLKLPA